MMRCVQGASVDYVEHLFLHFDHARFHRRNPLCNDRAQSGEIGGDGFDVANKQVKIEIIGVLAEITEADLCHE